MSEPRFKTRGAGKFRVVLQNENGPCPLIAIANCLVVMGGLEVPTEVSAQWLLDNFRSRAPLSVEQEHALVNGHDADPRFDGSFRSGSDLFALFGLQLVHGWVMPVDPLYNSSQSYEELTAEITTDSNEVTTAVGEQFLAEYPTQISPWGVDLLRRSIQDGDVVVLFRNNHYATLVKRDQNLYTLVTDVGFRQYGDVVWEDLEGGFYEANFQPRADCAQDEAIARALSEEGQGHRGVSRVRQCRGQAAQAQAQAQARAVNPTGIVQAKPTQTTKASKKCAIA